MKSRAHYQSELSGNKKKLSAHHLRGKANYIMRFSLDNGFCCSSGEHYYGFHNTGRRAAFEERVKAIRGKDIFEKLEHMSRFKGKTNLFMVKVYLMQKFKEFENAKI